MKTKDPKKYINELELQNSREAFIDESLERALTQPGLDTQANVEQSFMNDKSLVSFVSEVNEQRREDILNSVLLAQLAANKKFPDENQIMDWYNEFVNVLNHIGWTIQAADFTPFESEGTTIEVENAIVSILTTAMGGALLPVILKTLDAIKHLSNSNGKIIAFEKNTHTTSKGAFQIGLAKEENDTVSLQLGTFLLTSSDEIKQILFFKSSKSKTTLQFCSRVGTLNEQAYSVIRDAIRAKLGFKANEFIANIDL